LEKNDRSAWVAEEMMVLSSKHTYEVNPFEIWKKIKVRTDSGKFLAILRELSSFREEQAQLKNIPRGHILKDDALIELCNMKPKTFDDLKKLRLYGKGNRSPELSRNILSAIKKGIDCLPEDYPVVSRNKILENKSPAMAELLRVLLKLCAEKYGVAQKIIATTYDLDKIASGSNDGPVFEGWRYDIFGKNALLLCEGKIGLAADGNKIKIVHVN
jgi:ribonuclease D